MEVKHLETPGEKTIRLPDLIAWDLNVAKSESLKNYYALFRELEHRLQKERYFCLQEW
jgi:hypothetical protein